MHPSVSNTSPSRLRIIDDTHTTPNNNASILPTHVHENACLSRDRLCNSLATKKPHERKYTWRSKKCYNRVQNLKGRNQAHRHVVLVRCLRAFANKSAKIFSCHGHAIHAHFVGGFKEATIWALSCTHYAHDCFHGCQMRSKFTSETVRRPDTVLGFESLLQQRTGVAPDLLPRWERQFDHRAHQATACANRTQG